MELTNQKSLLKLRKKNKSFLLLTKAIDKLIKDFKDNDWENKIELKKIRIDQDQVHNDGFFFFDINVHRVLILIEFDEQEATVVWVGTHQQYLTIFKNNKITTKKWLKANDWI